MYYANINSRNILTDIDISPISEDEYGSSDVQNIEVSEEIYNNTQTYGQNYYIYSDGEIVINISALLVWLHIPMIQVDRAYIL